MLAVVAVAVLLTVAVAALLGVTAAPLLVALSHAERRRASPTRVGVAAAGGSLLALLLAVAGLRAGAPAPALVFALVVAWAVPVVLARTDSRWAGRAGAHERVRASG